MPNDIRPHPPGATVLFTLGLVPRGGALLVSQMGALRNAVRPTRRERPFDIAAWVVPPDHRHCLWTLPEGDADFSTRMGAIKARLSMGLRRSGWALQERFWEHHIRNEADFNAHVR